MNLNIWEWGFQSFFRRKRARCSDCFLEFQLNIGGKGLQIVFSFFKLELLERGLYGVPGGRTQNVDFSRHSRILLESVWKLKPASEWSEFLYPHRNLFFAAYLRRPVINFVWPKVWWMVEAQLWSLCKVHTESFGGGQTETSGGLSKQGGWKPTKFFAPLLLLLFRFPLTMISCSFSTCTWQALMRQAPINELKGNHSFHWILLFINCLKASIKQNNLADASFFCPGHLIFPFIQLKKRSINSQCLFFSASIFEPEFTVTQFLGYICRWSIKNLIFGPILGPKRTWTACRRPLCKAVNTKRLCLRCPVMIVAIF